MKKARSVAKILTWHVDDDYPLPSNSSKFGLNISMEMSCKKVYGLDELVSVEATMRRPSVQYVPTPYGTRRKVSFFFRKAVVETPTSS